MTIIIETILVTLTVIGTIFVCNCAAYSCLVCTAICCNCSYKQPNSIIKTHTN